MKVSVPIWIHRKFTEHFRATREKIFPLLCPVREAEWIDGWDPIAVFSESGVMEKDCVFLTPSEPNNSIWVVTRYKPENYELDIMKVLPGLAVGKIAIKLLSDGDRHSMVEVSYTFTSIGEDGDDFVRCFPDELEKSFDKTWNRELKHYLETGSMLRSAE